MDSIKTMYNNQQGANVEVQFSNGKITIIDKNLTYTELVKKGYFMDKKRRIKNCRKFNKIMVEIVADTHYNDSTIYRQEVSVWKD